MPGDMWTEDEDRKAAEMRAAGHAYSMIGRELGRTSDGVVGRLKKLAKQPTTKATTASIPKEQIESFVASSQEARIIELEKKLAAYATGQQRSTDRLPVETVAEAPIDPAELWHRAELESVKSIKYAFDRSRFAIDFNKTDANLPVGVSFISDQHISPGNTIAFDRMRQDAELIAETPGLYACLGGDGVDNHIKIRAASLAARSQPHDQYKLFNWYLGIFAPKIVALISGNHDAWTDQIAGVDMVAEIARQQRLCYCPAEAHVTAQVGSVEYKLSFRHQYRFNSSMNQGHAPKQWYRFGEELFDIGIVCHHHEPHIESFEAHGETRWVGRPGSYQITSSYTRQFGWNSTKPTCPTFILYPGSRDIVGFHNVNHAVRFLKSERGGK